MHRFIDGGDRIESALLPQSLKDYVDAENPVRLIEVFTGIGTARHHRIGLFSSK